MYYYALIPTSQKIAVCPIKKVPYSAKFLRHTIFVDCVVGSVSRKFFSLTKEILLAMPLRGAQFNGA